MFDCPLLKIEENLSVHLMESFSLKGFEATNDFEHEKADKNILWSRNTFRTA
jgi:hypothetical protein